MFGGLGLQGQPDRYSNINIFEDSFPEEGAEVGQDIFEGGFKTSASEARNNFDSKYLADQRQEYQYAYTLTQGYQKLEGKINHTIN